MPNMYLIKKGNEYAWISADSYDDAIKVVEQAIKNHKDGKSIIDEFKELGAECEVADGFDALIDIDARIEKRYSFKELFLADMEFGMFSIGATMEECFEHIFECCDLEIVEVEISVDSEYERYAVRCCEDDDSQGTWVYAKKFRDTWSVEFWEKSYGVVETLSYAEYSALTFKFAEYIKRSALTWVTQ